MNPLNNETRQERSKVTAYSIPYGLKGPIVLLLIDRPKQENPLDAYLGDFRAGLPSLSSLIKRTEHDTYILTIDGRKVEGSMAVKAHQAICASLKPFDQISQDYLASLALKNPKAELEWKRTLSEDEKEVIFKGTKDGFEIKVSCLTKSVALNQAAVVYSAQISLKEQMIGPHYVDGCVAERLFEKLEKS